MTHELQILVLAALLQIVQFVIFSVTANLQIGPVKALSPRDEAIHLTGIAGRAQRAMNNHFEGLILFGIAAITVTLADKCSALTETCALAYLIARILYVPAYLMGLVPWRSLIWAVGLVATTLMLIAALA